MIIVIMGVSGAGKTTVGRLLAARIGAPFSDADEFHSAANVAKMHAGIPLTDEDRAPWLARMRNAIETWIADDEDHILACSTLKARYRSALRHSDSEVHFVYLQGTFAAIEARLKSRPDHFFAPQLLESQFAALEPPGEDEALCIDASAEPEVIVERVTTALALGGGEY